MLAFLTFIPSLISGLFTTVSSITAAISNEKIAAITATTDVDRIAAQERVNTLSLQRDVLIADASHGSWDIWIRTIVATGPAIYLLKIFLWDKVFGSFGWTMGRTDDLSPMLAQVVMVVLGFYFLSATSTTVARIFASRK